MPAPTRATKPRKNSLLWYESRYLVYSTYIPGKACIYSVYLDEGVWYKLVLDGEGKVRHAPADEPLLEIMHDQNPHFRAVYRPDISDPDNVCSY